LVVSVIYAAGVVIYADVLFGIGPLVWLMLSIYLGIFLAVVSIFFKLSEIERKERATQA